MNKIFRTVTLAATLLATVVATTVPASADEFYRRRHHGNNGGDALAAGAVGLIAGALIGGALAQPQRPRRQYIDPPIYNDPQPVYGDQFYGDQDPYVQPRRVYVDPYANDGYYQQPRVIIRRQVYREQAPVPIYRQPAYRSYSGLEPWSPEWFDYCSQRYRSFNPNTGTFRGKHGRVYFCNAG